MKVKEALHHITTLELKLEALGLRITCFSKDSRPVTPILEQSVSVVNRLRDLCSAVAWTNQQVSYQGLTLGSYIIQRDALQKILKSVDLSVVAPDIFDVYAKLQEDADDLDLIIESINSQSELQVPEIKDPKPADDEEPKEE